MTILYFICFGLAIFISMVILQWAGIDMGMKHDDASIAVVGLLCLACFPLMLFYMMCMIASFMLKDN